MQAARVIKKIFEESTSFLLASIDDTLVTIFAILIMQNCNSKIK